SGAWDPALRSAIARAPSRRFSSYWAVRGELGGVAQKLAGDRGIVPIQIENADGFFPKLAENLASLREYDRPHPLSVQSAVASLKRYLAEDRYRIRLHDLLVGTVHDTQERWKSAGIEMKSPRPDDATTVARVKAYDASMELLLPMGKELGKWVRPDQFPVVCELLQSLAGDATLENGSFNFWRELSRYPATQLLYAVGISALKADNLELIGRIFATDFREENRKVLPAVAVLLPMCLIDKRESLWPLHDGQKRHTPLSDWLENIMRGILAPGSNGDQYNDPFTPIFDEFEMLGAAAYRALMRGQREWLWVPFGCWGWRRSDDAGRLERLKADLESNGKQSKLMRLGIFKNGEAEAQAVLDEVIEFAGKLNLW
ncbi:MAG: hypothetical protein KA233_08620, partial [Novosphingobium sp.]|nr:hypothetical protein [Novosphingobium sp.]